MKVMVVSHPSEFPRLEGERLNKLDAEIQKWWNCIVELFLDFGSCYNARVLVRVLQTAVFCT